MVLLSVSLCAQPVFEFKTKEIEPVTLMATYSMRYTEDSLNTDFLPQEDMLLLIGKNTSCFMSYNYYLFVNSLKKITTDIAYKEWLMNPDLRPPVTRFTYRIIKANDQGKITFYGRVMPDFFTYDEPREIFKWTLCSDTISINGYLCQKAKTKFGGRTWIAWFSTALPYSDGPYKFSGLPGLIVKLNDTQNHYTFEMLSIAKPSEMMMIEIGDENYISTTKKGFFKAEDAFHDDIINRAKEAGLSSDSQQTAARNMAKRNNPIELERK